MNIFTTRLSKKILCVIIGLLAFNNVTFSQAWQWAKSGGGAVLDQGKKVCTDAAGNIYVAGEFSLSISIGSITISGNGNLDIFLAKYDPNGNVLWAKGIGGTGAENIGGIATSTAGDIALFGSFKSPTFTVAPFSVSNATTSGTSDIFICRFSSVGAAQYLTSYGNAGDQYAKGCAYDALNYLWIAGDYTSTNFALGTTTLTNSSAIGFSDIFFGATTNVGGILSAYDTGGANCTDLATGIDTYSNNAVYISGTFGNTITTIGTATLATNGISDAFLAKYNGAGGFQWVVGAGAPGADESRGVSVDATGNPLITGFYTGGNMVVGTQTLTNTGNTDCFTAKYNSSGVFQWAQSAAGTGFEYTFGITTDQNSNAFITGNFASSTLSTGTLNVVNTNTTNLSDVFVIKYNSAGIPQWGTKAIGANSEFGRGIACDNIGNVFVTGNFNIAASTSFGSTLLTSVGGDDFFLGKIGCLTTNIITPLSVCAGSSATLSATGATTYSWSTGATSSSIVITPTATSSYTVTGTTGACVGTSATATITHLPASMYPGSNLSLLCKQKSVINTTCSPAATSVSWTPSTNLSSSSVLNPTVTALSGTTVYSVTATLNNGCVKSGTVSVSSYAQQPDICQVTVDSLSNNNEIYWEKTLYPQADSFVVYREVSINTYKRIAAISRLALSMYVDTNRSIGPANGDPNLTYYKYKLQIRDSCGNYSTLSKWHETIFIQDQLNGNFNWNSYAIESSTSTPVSIYNLKRRLVSTGTETLVTSTTGGLATDPFYNSFWPLNVKWFVDAVGFNCNPTAKMMVLKTKTKSNQSNDKLALGVNTNQILNNVNIYPNPAKDIINIDLNSLAKAETSVEIINALGQLVYNTSSLNQHLVLNTTDLVGGVYIVNIKQNDKTIAVKKVVIDR